MTLLDSYALGLHEDLEVGETAAQQVAGGTWSGYWTWTGTTWQWTWVWTDPVTSWTTS